MPYPRKRHPVVKYFFVALLVISGITMLPAFVDALPPATIDPNNFGLAIFAAFPFGIALKALTSRR